MTVSTPEGERLPPNLPVTAYQTFQVASPLATHWRPATCAEINCPQYLHGWRVRLDGLSVADRWAIHTSGRRFVRHDIAEGETWLVFEAGQPCFAADDHKTLIGRPELFLVRDGDWRGNPTGRVSKHTRAEDWVDDFATHQGKIADAVKRG